MRHQRPTADLDTERLMKETAANLQQVVNDSAPLRDLSAAHRLVPDHTDLSRHANGNGTRFVCYWKRALAQVVAMKRCGASRSDAEMVVEEMRWFLAALYSDEVPEPMEVIREAEIVDAEEDGYYAEFSTASEHGPEDYERLAEHLERQSATSRVASVRARQVARERGMQ